MLLIGLTLAASTLAEEVGANESKRRFCLETPLVGKTIRELLAMDCQDIWSNYYNSTFDRYDKISLKKSFTKEGVMSHYNWHVDLLSNDRHLIIHYFNIKDYKGASEFIKSTKFGAVELDLHRAVNCIEDNPRRNIKYYDKKLRAYSSFANPVYTYCKTIDPYKIERMKKMGFKYDYEKDGLNLGGEWRPEFSNLDQIKSDNKKKVAAPNKANNICMKAKDYEGCMKYQGTK